MKDYLNSSEKLKILAFLNVAEMSEDFLEGNLLSKKEKGDLKRSMTYLTKTVLAVLERLNPSAKKTMNNAIKSNKLYISSKADVEAFARKRSADIDAAYEVNKEYMDLVELTMHYTCNNCTKNGCECDLYRHFEENSIPELDESQNQNCKYSYNLINLVKERE